jgi:hypothetical protein
MLVLATAELAAVVAQQSVDRRALGLEGRQDVVVHELKEVSGSLFGYSRAQA